MEDWRATHECFRCIRHSRETILHILQPFQNCRIAFAIFHFVTAGMESKRNYPCARIWLAICYPYIHSVLLLYEDLWFVHWQHQYRATYVDDEMPNTFIHFSFYIFSPIFHRQVVDMYIKSMPMLRINVEGAFCV